MSYVSFSSFLTIFCSWFWSVCNYSTSSHSLISPWCLYMSHCLLSMICCCVCLILAHLCVFPSEMALDTKFNQKWTIIQQKTNKNKIHLWSSWFLSIKENFKNHFPSVFFTDHIWMSSWLSRDQMRLAHIYSNHVQRVKAGQNKHTTKQNRTTFTYLHTLWHLRCQKKTHPAQTSF